MEQYKILIHWKTLQKVETYQKAALATKEIKSGSYLRSFLEEKDVASLEISEFIELIIRTKRPQIFAECAVYGNGSDWSQSELSILGDINFSVPVTVYDNGKHSSPKLHSEPFCANLLYIPGALLRNDLGKIPADWEEVTISNQINSDAYYSLYERRLLPAFLHADSIAKQNNQQALITIPGLGCGQFAGRFQGSLGFELQKTIIRFLKNHSIRLPNIRAVYYDPYKECDNSRIEIDHISLFIRPLTKGNIGKPQLCNPRDYEENDDNFSGCRLFSFVAWDHVSWPGNDFYIGSRATDDGVKAAATNSMAVITGIEGNYNTQTNKYNPPSEYRNWRDLIFAKRIQLYIEENLVVYSTSE